MVVRCFPDVPASTWLRGVSAMTAAASSAAVHASRSLLQFTNSTAALLPALPTTKSTVSPVPCRSLASVMLANWTVQVEQSWMADATKSKSKTVFTPDPPLMVMFLQVCSRQEQVGRRQMEQCSWLHGAEGHPELRRSSGCCCGVCLHAAQAAATAVKHTYKFGRLQQATPVTESYCTPMELQGQVVALFPTPQHCAHCCSAACPRITHLFIASGLP